MESFPATPEYEKQQRRKRIRERAQESSAGALLMLSRLAIRLSVQGERNRRVRHLRRALLLRRWSELSGDILRRPFPAVPFR